MLPGMDAAAADALAGATLGDLRTLVAACRSAPERARSALERALGSDRAAQECVQVRMAGCTQGRKEGRTRLFQPPRAD